VLPGGGCLEARLAMGLVRLEPHVSHFFAQTGRDWSGLGYPDETSPNETS
jgi:hypothetical protein